MSTAAIKLANKVQGHDSNATPPAWLLTAVERHLIEFPRDDEWLLECTPGTFGVGQLTASGVLFISTDELCLQSLVWNLIVTMISK